MTSVKLSASELQYMALLEKMTGAVSKDCLLDDEENKIVFVVNKGQMGLAIGKKGSKIQRVTQNIGKKVEVVEYSDDPAEFAKNLFHPYRVVGVSIQETAGSRTARVDIDARDRDQAIGRKGKNLLKAKTLSQRHHGLDIMII